MSRKTIVILSLLLVAVAGLFFVGPVERVLNDPAPSAEAMAGTEVIDKPLTVPLPEPVPEIEPVALSASLSKRLVIRESVDVQVPEGSVRLLRGMAVSLAKDGGEKVDVKFGNIRKPTHVTVPRGALANREQQSEPSTFGPIVAVQKTVNNFFQAPAGSLAVEAKEIGTGRGVARSYGVGSEWDRTDKETFRTKGLAVTFRNLSRRPTGDCEIVVCWVGRRLADDTRHISHAETFRVNLAPLSEHQATSWCPLLDARQTKYSTTGATFLSGSKFDGWFAIVKRDSQMLVGRGGTDAYNTILRDPAQLDPLLASWGGSTQGATSSMPQWRDERPGASAIPKPRTPPTTY